MGCLAPIEPRPAVHTRIAGFVSNTSLHPSGGPVNLSLGCTTGHQGSSKVQVSRYTQKVEISRDFRTAPMLG